ncbi:MAG TPA: hypothetical protein VHL78_13625 [Actinomycetota bacterium]|nr:hypothetical protein [Actinomycetota bacterium]
MSGPGGPPGGNGDLAAARAHPEPGVALIFQHIPKTAGSTLRQVVARQYPAPQVFVQEPQQQPATSPYLRYLRGEQDLPAMNRPGFDPNGRFRRELAALPGDRLEAIHAVIGHLWFGLHEALPRPATYMTVLRDPLERVLSLFHYHVGFNGLTGTLDDYLEAGRDFEIDNGQTRYLCGRLPDADVRFVPCTPDMLDRAKRHLVRAFSVVGTVERFDESLLLMTRVFGWRIPWYEPVNVNRERPPSRAVPPSIREHILERNRFDQELYRFADRLLDERLAEQQPPIDRAAVRGFRRSNLLQRHAALRRIYPLARPVLRTARSAGRGVRRLLGVQGP